jgi:hypothetical protein
MIKVDKYTNIDRGADPTKEYYINQNGTYLSLTKAELEKIVSDLKLLSIAAVMRSVCCGEELVRFKTYGYDECCGCGKTYRHTDA